MLQKNLNVLQDSHHGCHRQPANWKRVAASSEKNLEAMAATKTADAG